MLRAVAALGLLACAACSGGGGRALTRASGTTSSTPIVTTTSTTANLATFSSTSTTSTVVPGPVVIRYRAERKTTDEATADFLETWERLRGVLEDAPHRLSQRQILEQWPEDWPRPSKSALCEWLKRAVNLGLVLRKGTGKRNDAFLYWLPEQEAKWRADPGYDEELESKLEQLR